MTFLACFTPEYKLQLIQGTCPLTLSSHTIFHLSQFRLISPVFQGSSILGPNLSSVWQKRHRGLKTPLVKQEAAFEQAK